MTHLFEGGNWQDGISAGYLYLSAEWPTVEREIFTCTFDPEGLPDRWAKIMLGCTNRVPKAAYRRRVLIG